MVATARAANAAERLGPAERIIHTCLTFQDHAYHGRPGIIVADATSPIGVKWRPVSHVVEGEGDAARKIVVAMPDLPQVPGSTKKPRQGRMPKGQRPALARLGVLHPTGKVVGEHDENVLVGTYRAPGLFPEACAWLYRRIAEVWQVDNEFAGKWASYAWTQEHEDLKVMLCAFMLAQSRVGAPQTERGKLLFFDLNLRDVGRAMVLLTGSKDKPGFNAKLVLRIRKILGLPEIVAINRELGFTHGPRSQGLKGWKRTAREWLQYREQNPAMLSGLVRVGFSGTLRTIAQTSEYCAESASFYEKLRWEQTPGAHGARTIAIGKKKAAAETWAGLDEVAICERIVKDRPDWKRIVGLLPADVGATRAIVAAAIESGCLSDKDLIIVTPTLEELGLLTVQEIRARWDRARAKATDQRAAHIARNVTNKETADALIDASEKALQKQVAEVARGLHVFVIVDRSASQKASLDKAKECLSKMVHAFELDKIHVAHFNSIGKELKIPHRSEAGVANAFKGIKAEGSTDYGSGVRALAHHKYLGQNWGDGATEDNLFLFVGDEEQRPDFTKAVEDSGLKPVAFALIKMPGEHGMAGTAVQRTANALGVPLLMVDIKTFEGDPFAIPRTLRTLIQSTPTGAPPRNNVAAMAPRKTLIDLILSTALLQPPDWA